MPAIEPAPQKAQPLLRLIVEAIRHHRIREGQPETFLSYSEALGLLGLRAPYYYAGSRLQKVGLTALNEWTVRHTELPKIAGLIVNKKTRRPGIGFARSHKRADDPHWEHWWLGEANRSINYDWRPYLTPFLRYRRVSKDAGGLPAISTRVRELPEYTSRIDVGPPARVRNTGIKVSDILTWLASGRTDTEIIRQHAQLTVEDIRASLAYAAGKEARLQPSFTARWAGKFKLPDPDLSDARLTFLLDRYNKAQ